MAGRIAFKCMACHSASCKVVVEGGVWSKGQRLHEQASPGHGGVMETLFTILLVPMIIGPLGCVAPYRL